MLFVHAVSCVSLCQMETRVEKGEEEFNNISTVMRAEIERFEVRPSWASVVRTRGVLDNS